MYNALKICLLPLKILIPSNLNSEEGKDEELVKMLRAVNIVESMNENGSYFIMLQSVMKNTIKKLNDESCTYKEITMDEINKTNKIVIEKEESTAMECDNAINRNEKEGKVIISSKSRSTIAILTSKIYQGASDLYSTVGSKGIGDKAKMILTPVSETILLDESNTLAAFLFGKVISEFICGFYYRNPKTYRYLKLTFLACIPIQFLCLYGTISPWFALTFIYYTLYCVLFMILPRNLTIYKLLFRNFTTLYGIYNIIGKENFCQKIFQMFKKFFVGYCITMMFLFKSDLRVVYFD